MFGRHGWTILAEVTIYPGGGEGAFRLIFLPINFIRVIIYLIPPTILAEVTIYPATLTALFWLVSRPLFTLGL